MAFEEVVETSDGAVSKVATLHAISQRRHKAALTHLRRRL